MLATLTWPAIDSNSLKNVTNIACEKVCEEEDNI